MEKLSTKQKLQRFRWIAVRCTAMTLCLAVTTFPARAEQVPSISAPATTTSFGSWQNMEAGVGHGNYPSGQAVCDTMAAAIGGLVLIFDSSGFSNGLQGQCRRYSPYITGGFDVWSVPAYVQQCPAGYGSSNSLVISATTFACTNNGAPNQCSAVAAGETSYKLDPGGKTCSRPDSATCPIDPLPPIPTGDLCTQSLDQGSGVDVNNACTSSLDDRWTKPSGGQMQCLADKINKLPLVPHFTKPSATIRTAAYQNHLLNVFNKLEEIKAKVRSAAQKQACASVIADVNVHKLRHGIVSEPSASDEKAPHVLGKAIDIPEAIANALIAKVTKYTTVTLLPNCSFCIPITTIASDVENYVQSATTNPPACNVRWGGRFGRVDNVHFQLP